MNTISGLLSLKFLAIASGPVKPSDLNKLSCYRGSVLFSDHRLDFQIIVLLLAPLSLTVVQQLSSLQHNSINGISGIPQGLLVRGRLTLNSLATSSKTWSSLQNKSMQHMHAQWSLYRTFSIIMCPYLCYIKITVIISGFTVVWPLSQVLRGDYT